MSVYLDRHPQIIVIDIMMPDGEGIDFVAQIRKTDKEIPIIFLTARTRPEDVVSGFEHGGNDYLKKPFSMVELIIRMQALLNKNPLHIPEKTQQIIMEMGHFSFHYPMGVLDGTNEKRTLTSREADLLFLLANNPNIIVERTDILRQLWNNDDYFSGRSLDVFISKLRRYLQSDPSVIIVNVRGKGYKLIYEFQSFRSYFALFLYKFELYTQPCYIQQKINILDTQVVSHVHSFKNWQWLAVLFLFIASTLYPFRIYLINTIQLFDMLWHFLSHKFIFNF